jgi:hypothetical protein
LSSLLILEPSSLSLYIWPLLAEDEADHRALDIGGVDHLADSGFSP